MTLLVAETPRRYARGLRQAQTEAERVLWLALRDRRLVGHKFRRQHPIGPFIIDFVCAEAELVVELDGGQHAERRAADEARTQSLIAQGYRVLRFWNNEVLGNLPGVLHRISEALGGRPSPQPSPQRGEGAGRRSLSPGGGEGRVRGRRRPRRGGDG